MMHLENKQIEFEWWITCLPDKIEHLIAVLPEEDGQRLDYSISRAVRCFHLTLICGCRMETPGAPSAENKRICL